MNINDYNLQGLSSLAYGLPPIVFLTLTCDGSIGKVANCLFENLFKIGVDVKFFTLEMGSLENKRIIQLQEKGKSLYTKTRTLLGAKLSRNYPDRPYGYDGFYIPDGVIDLSSIESTKKAGLLHFHLVDGMIDWQTSRNVILQRPLVWTVHAMRPFTAGCVYAAGCKKYKIGGGCKECPQLGISADDKDLANINFSAKSANYKSLNLTMVTPSHWMAECVCESILMKPFPCDVIPNCIDLDVFVPFEKNKARALFNLPDRKIILFGANGVKRRNKGFHVLVEALNKFKEKWVGSLPLLLFFGGEISKEELPLDFECYSLGKIDDENKLAAIYSSADVFVLSSFQDNLPTVLIESQACGTPGVGFYETGAEDIIENGKTGYLVKHPGLPLSNGKTPSKDGAYRVFDPDSTYDLADKIKQILELSPVEYTFMSNACREHALAKYSPSIVLEQHIKLYRKILHLPEIKCTF